MVHKILAELSSIQMELLKLPNEDIATSGSSAAATTRVNH